jgi:hypothetical protein
MNHSHYSILSITTMLAMARRQEVYVDGKPVSTSFTLAGIPVKTVPLVLGMTKDVKLGHAGLGGTNKDNIHADTPNFVDSDVAGRIRDHARADYRYHNS